MDLNHKQAQIFCPTFMPQRLEEKKGFTLVIFLPKDFYSFSKFISLLWFFEIFILWSKIRNVLRISESFQNLTLVWET